MVKTANNRPQWLEGGPKIDPQCSRNVPGRAREDPRNAPRRLLERLLAFIVDPKKLKDGLLEAKSPPRRPAGGQEFSKRRFWSNF